MVELKKERFTGSLGAVLKLAGFIYVAKTWVWSGSSSGDIRIPILTIFGGVFLTIITLNKLGKKLGNQKLLEYYFLSLGMPYLLAQFMIVFILLGAFSETPTDNLMGTSLYLAFPVSWVLMNYFQFKTWATLYRMTNIRPFNLLAVVIKWGVIGSIIGIELKWILFPFRMSTFYTAVLFSISLFMLTNALQIVAFLKLPEEIKGPEGSPLPS